MVAQSEEEGSAVRGRREAATTSRFRLERPP